MHNAGKSRSLGDSLSGLGCGLVSFVILLATFDSEGDNQDLAWAKAVCRLNLPAGSSGQCSLKIHPRLSAEPPHAAAMFVLVLSLLFAFAQGVRDPARKAAIQIPEEDEVPIVTDLSELMPLCHEEIVEDSCLLLNEEEIHGFFLL